MIYDIKKIWRKRLTLWINEWINYKAVYRTAPTDRQTLQLLDQLGPEGRVGENASIKTCWGSLEQIETNLGFNSPKTWCWSLLGRILVVQNTFLLNNLLVFGWGYTLVTKDWRTGYQALSSLLKCYAENAISQFSWNIHNPTFHPFLCTFESKVNAYP